MPYLDVFTSETGDVTHPGAVTPPDDQRIGGKFVHILHRFIHSMPLPPATRVMRDAAMRLRLPNKWLSQISRSVESLAEMPAGG
jgi:hypothetical protein